MKKVYEYSGDMPPTVRKKYFSTPEKCIETLENEYLNNKSANYLVYSEDNYNFNGTMLLRDYIPEECKTEEVCKLAVSVSDMNFRWMPVNLRTPEICEIAIRKGYLKHYHLDENLWTPELCKIAIKMNGDYLKAIPNYFRTNELCETAIKNNAYLEDVPEEYRTFEICKIALTHLRNCSGETFESIPAEIRNNPQQAKMLVNIFLEMEKANPDKFYYRGQNNGEYKTFFEMLRIVLSNSIIWQEKSNEND